MSSVYTFFCNLSLYLVVAPNFFTFLRGVYSLFIIYIKIHRNIRPRRTLSQIKCRYYCRKKSQLCQNSIKTRISTPFSLYCSSSKRSSRRYNYFMNNFHSERKWTKTLTDDRKLVKDQNTREHNEKETLILKVK